MKNMNKYVRQIATVLFYSVYGSFDTCIGIETSYFFGYKFNKSGNGKS